MIWNEICDALIYANRRKETELPVDYETLGLGAKGGVGTDLFPDSFAFTTQQTEARFELLDMVARVRAAAVPTVQKGIDAMIMMQQGYSSREIGEKMDAAPNLVTAWVSKARKYLRTCPELQVLYSNGGNA